MRRYKPGIEITLTVSGTEENLGVQRPVALAGSGPDTNGGRAVEKSR